MAKSTRRYRQDPKTGKMKGSAPGVVDPPATDDPWRNAAPLEATTTVQDVQYGEIFTAFAQTKSTSAALFDPAAFPRTFLQSDHPVAVEVRRAFTGLDATQREHAIAAYLTTVENELRKTPGVTIYAGVDQDEWATWCNEQAARVGPADEQLLAAYQAMAETGAPTQFEFVYLTRARLHARSVTQSYDREMRYLAGYHGKDPDDIRLAVERQRFNYQNMPENQRPDVPEWFADGMKSSYWGKDVIRKPPMDDATMWGFYSVLSDKSLTAGIPDDGTGEYVVFDTETTGLSESAAIIQITAIRYDKEGVEQERISTYIRPDDPAVFNTKEAARASEVTGLTYDSIKDAPTFREISTELRGMMEGRTLVAHNLMFDYPRVQRAFAQSADSDAPASARVLPLSPIVDTLRLARWVQPNPGVARKDWKHTLQASCERAEIGFDPNEAHDALYDVERTNDLYRHLRTAPLGGTTKDG